MNRTFSLAFAALLSIISSSFQAAHAKSPIDFVNPFIGTEFNGHTFPGAALPFGMVQPGPETGNQTWDYCSGYRYADSVLLGFSQDRLNGTGCSDLGDILVMPFGKRSRADWSSLMDKSSETASPGYYKVYLPENGVLTEITCTQRVSFFKFRYDGKSRNVHLNFDTIIGKWNKVLSAEIKPGGKDCLEGSINIKGWVKRTLYFSLKFSEGISACSVSKEGNAPSYILSFPDSGKELLLKVALSTVSVEGARANMQAELSGWDFRKTLAMAREEWKKYLEIGTIEGSDAQKTTFYTCLYHLFLQPADIADVDGRYNGADNQVHSSASGHHYSTLSQWDTFRAANPFYTLFTPEHAAGIAESMMRQCDEQGYLPIWALCGKENHCMIGNHSVPPLAEAALLGLVDPDKAFEKIYRSLTVNHRGSHWDIYDKYGYLPCDMGKNESVSKTLEMGYDDYCAALLAEKLGKSEEASFFRKRSMYYKNLFDPSTGLARGRRQDGSWRDPFYPFSYTHDAKTGGDYTEGNAWHYTWHVMQDIPGLVKLMGGEEAFTAKLDTLFTLNPSEEETGKLSDVTGLIGQYAHGNEPSHHVAYLYALAGKPEKTEELVSRITDEFYLPKPDGLCGNDDCGQMSAWYLFSACGFYPVNPISGEYVFGVPQVSKVRLKLPGGKKLEIRAPGLDSTHRAVEAIYLNGQKISGHISRKQILEGGVLTFKVKEFSYLCRP